MKNNKNRSIGSDEFHNSLKVGDKISSTKKRKKDNGDFGRGLEEFFGIKENNCAFGDITLNDGQSWELKTTGGKSKTSLFSQEPKWKAHPKYTKCREFFDNYSYQPTDIENPEIFRLNSTLTTQNYNNRGFKISISSDEKEIHLEHIKEGSCATWNISKLLKTATTKLKNLKLVKHDGTGTVTEINTRTDFDTEIFLSMIKRGDIVLDLRLGLKYNKRGKLYMKNRGCAWRVNSKKTLNMYDKS